MNTHIERPVTSRLSGLAPLGKVAKWLNSKLRARRARRMEEETLACLKELEPSLLNDIGADIGKLGELNSTLAPQDPHVAARPAAPRDRRGVQDAASVRIRIRVRRFM